MTDRSRISLPHPLDNGQMKTDLQICVVVYISRWSRPWWRLRPLSLWHCLGCPVAGPATLFLERVGSNGPRPEWVAREAEGVNIEEKHPIIQNSHSKLSISWCWKSVMMWTCGGLICCCWKWEAIYLFRWEWYSVPYKSLREAEYPSYLYPSSSLLETCGHVAGRLPDQSWCTKAGAGWSPAFAIHYRLNNKKRILYKQVLNS